MMNFNKLFGKNVTHDIKSGYKQNSALSSDSMFEICLLRKSMDLFLYDNGLRREGVKLVFSFRSLRRNFSRPSQ